MYVRLYVFAYVAGVRAGIWPCMQRDCNALQIIIVAASPLHSRYIITTDCARARRRLFSRLSLCFSSV